MKNIRHARSTPATTDTINVVVFSSRNKDNRNVDNYSQRSYGFLTTRKPDDLELLRRFNNFVNEGAEGERSRFYYNVNSRSQLKTNMLTIKFLLDNQTYSSERLPDKIAKLAMDASNRVTDKWFFDYDSTDFESFKQFYRDVKTSGQFSDDDLHAYRTLNGFHLVVTHGFDSRQVMESHENVTLKRDDMRLICSQIKGQDVEFVQKVNSSSLSK